MIKRKHQRAMMKSKAERAKYQTLKLKMHEITPDSIIIDQIEKQLDGLEVIDED